MTAIADGARDAAIPRALGPPAADRSSIVFSLALLGAALAHLFLILTVSFEMPDPEPKPLPQEALELLILKEPGTPTDEPAPDAALSQLSRAGVSTGPEAPDSVWPDLAEPVDAPTEGPDVPPASRAEPVESEIAATLVESPVPELPPPENPVEPETPEVLAVEQPRDSPPEPSLAPPALPEPVETEPPRIDAAQILASRNQEIARLTASLEARSAAYANRVRRKSVSASTQEYRYASYLGAWARKVERIGNLNYPQAAKEQHIYGSLILHVAVRSDGSVEQIRVVRSSGYDLLDQAAVRIVELAAPFAPFPPDIAAETDALDIIRTWQFLRGGRLGWESQ